MTGDQTNHSSLWFTPEQEATLRSAVASGYREVAPASTADLVADLSVHAAQEALRAFERVLKTAPDFTHARATGATAASIVIDRLELLKTALLEETNASETGVQFERIVQL